jgi:hypothetical protein
VDKRRPRGPHPALNYEHFKTAHPALVLEESVFKTAAQPTKEEERHISKGRAALVGGAAAAPFAGLIGQKKIIHDPYTNPNVERFDDLQHLQDWAEPGDVMVTSKPKSTWKTFQSPMTGSEFYHAQVVPSTKHTRSGGRWEEVPQTLSVEDPYEKDRWRRQGREAIKKDLPTVAEEMANRNYSDVVLLRPKKPLTEKELKVFQEQAIDRARQSYGGQRAISSWAKDMFVPKIPGVTEKLSPAHEVKYEMVGGKKVPVLCDGDVCSTLPAAAFEKATGRSVVPGKGAGAVMPTDFLRSEEFEPVGAWTTGKFKPRGKLQPYLARGAVGAGLAGTAVAATTKPEETAGTLGGAYLGTQAASRLVDRGYRKQIANTRSPRAIQRLEDAREAAFPTIRDVIEARSVKNPKAGEIAKRFARVNLPGKIIGGGLGLLAGHQLSKAIRKKDKPKSTKKARLS